jgi:hypothetical protein
MIFDLDARPSDSPFVERVWRAHTNRPGTFLSIAAHHWEMVVTRYEGKLTLTVRGPETKATPIDSSIYGEWVGIVFKSGAFMPNLPPGKLIDVGIDLPAAGRKSFCLNGSTWEFPNYEIADAFVECLVRRGILIRDPIVDAVLRGQQNNLSPRSIQRRFLYATGLTQGSLYQIERARIATLLLRQDVPILDVVEQAGYADQPHLTRALKRWIGKTPAELIRKKELVELSLLFKTGFFP